MQIETKSATRRKAAGHAPNAYSLTPRSVNIGTDNKTELGGSVGLNYNAKSGAWGASVGLKMGLGQKGKDGYSNWAEVSYNRNNIGRDNQSSGVSANIRRTFSVKGNKECPDIRTFQKAVNTSRARVISV
ncbi:hypothetical protein [Leptospira alexanderi]|uniref:hypothetical protein n=1 Tax=Leptospira alexanderi TaxID=100053 RepID=UPI000990B738|nr:hypothetical protein [Leptospira alexanderi]